ncbi:Peptide alpha-N-acetyltransferase protein [Dioscorea alata]|uniref:Peptide alpha-N-acetyltransferase protein n=1 Tax=Dioscorea alata TaxID=55571 RepID=A0ACB7WSZ5_DIOAL|nr:Peptide alpha-N-acetyltransferase protein [Dioscorea alata]
MTKSVPLGVSSSPVLSVKALPIHLTTFSPSISSKVQFRVGVRVPPTTSNIVNKLSLRSESGICGASQAVDLFPSNYSEVIVRDARLEDCWEVADTHCSSFFPDYTFPIDLALRIDRFVALLSGFSVPLGCMRACLVAISGPSLNDNLYCGSEQIKFGDLEGKFSLNRGSVAGILTIDTVADFLPRKGPLHQRRTGIAYISNVAVRETERRKGIAKKLVAKAEVRARSWGCRAVALHCDSENLAALKLYLGQGFKCIKVPDQAKWPQPKAASATRFNFMMKLLSPNRVS